MDEQSGMSKRDPTEEALERLSALKAIADDALLAKEVKPYFANRSTLVIAKAAKIAHERGLSGLIPELAATFHKLMKDPARLDKGCVAVIEIAVALYQMDYREAGLYQKGIHHVQMEASFGPPVDAAAALRGICAQALVRTPYPQALDEVVSLLVDTEVPARVGAVKALATNGGEAGALVLRLKVLMGDVDVDVMAECFSGLLLAIPDHSLEFVASYIDSDDSAVAEAAVLALGGSRLPAAIDILEQKWNRTVRGSLRKTLLLALATSRDQGALNFLITLIDQTNVEIASNVVAALAVHKNSERIRQAVGKAIDRRHELPLVEAFRREFVE